MPIAKKKTAPVETPKVETTNNSILRFILSLNTTRNSLDFGINENCRLIKIDNTERMKEGQIVKRNTYMTFAKYNTKNENIGQNEFNYFNLDHTSDKVIEHFISQLAQLTYVISILSPENIDEFNPIAEFESEEDLEKALRGQKSCLAIQKAMSSQFEEILKEVIGDESPLLAIKVVTDKTGKFFNLPREQKFCALMTEDYSFLKISPYERKLKDNALLPQTAIPDSDGAAPKSSKKGIMDL